MIKLLAVYGSLFDVFIGDGWEGWSRVSVKRDRVFVVGGLLLTAEQLSLTLNEVKAWREKQRSK